jgi:hypothetical protein
MGITRGTPCFRTKKQSFYQYFILSIEYVKLFNVETIKTNKISADINILFFKKSIKLLLCEIVYKIIPSY